MNPVIDVAFDVMIADMVNADCVHIRRLDAPGHMAVAYSSLFYD